VPAALGLAAWLVAGGCASPPERTAAQAGNLAVSMREEKAAAGAAQDRPQAAGLDAAMRRPALVVGPSAAAPPAPSGSDAAPRPEGVRAEEPSPEGPPAKGAAGRLEGFIDPLTRRSDRVLIALDGCLRRALAHNLTVQVARYGPPIARTGIIEAEALFDPSWFMNNAVGRLKQQSGALFTGPGTFISKTWSFSTGVQALAPTGASVGLTQSWAYQNTNSAFLAPDPQYANNLGLSLRQPLLRGAGAEVATAPIVLARLDQKISVAELRTSLMATLLAVERTYWSLVTADTRIRAVSEAVEAAKENRRILQRRFEEGQARRAEVSLAQSAVTSRQADLVSARLQLVQASDLLKRLINDPQLPLEDPVVLEATELPIAAPMPIGRETLQASLVAAMRMRPELAEAEDRLDQAAVRERVAQSARLPQLDATGSYNLSGLAGRLGPAFEKEFGAQFHDWSVGLELSVPIGNRARTAAYQRSQLQQGVALNQREDARQQVFLEVSDAVRSLAASEELILATRAAREAAEQSLHDQQANVEAGLALFRNLLDAQRDLADAKVREMEAMTSYITGLAALERAKGTLLEYNNVRVLDDGAVAGHP